MPPKPIRHDDDDDVDDKVPGSPPALGVLVHDDDEDDDDVLSVPATPVRTPSPEGGSVRRQNTGSAGYWVPPMAPDYGYFVPGAPSNVPATPPSPPRDIVKVDTFRITISVASPQDKSLRLLELYITDFAHHGTLVDAGFQLARNSKWIESIAFAMALEMGEFCVELDTTDYIVFGQPLQAESQAEAIAIFETLLKSGRLQVYYRWPSQDSIQASSSSSGAASSSSSAISSTAAGSSGTAGRGRLGRRAAEKNLQKNPQLPKPPDGKGKP